MRMNTPRLLTAGLTMATVMTVVYAAGPHDAQLEPKAYLSVAFDGARTAAHHEQFFYGLRLDRDRRFGSIDLPPVADLNFNRQGFNQARLNGMSVIYRNNVMQQNEGESPANDGMFSNFTFVDWSLIAVGAVGIGFGISEVVNQKDTRDPVRGGSTTGGTTTGGTTTGTTLGGVLGGTTTGTTLGGVLGTFRTTSEGLDETRNNREYQEWLDGGTGQMGDLGAR